MTPVFRAINEVGGNNSTSRNAVQPGSTVIGDLLLCGGIVDGSVGTVPVALSGWNSIGQVFVNGAQTFDFAVFWLIAAAAGPQSHAASWGGGNFYNQFAITAIQAGTFDPASPIAASAIQNNDATSTSVVFPSTSPAMTDCLSCLLGGIDQAGTLTPPASYTERLDNTIGGYFADLALVASGATGTKTATISTGRPTGAAHVAVAPVPAAGPGPRPGSRSLLGVGR